MRQCNKCNAILPGDPLQCVCGSGDLEKYITSHGGARPGAGRNRLGKVRTTISLTERADTILRDMGDGSLSKGIERLVKHYRWSKI